MVTKLDDGTWVEWREGWNALRARRSKIDLQLRPATESMDALLVKEVPRLIQNTTLVGQVMATGVCVEANIL